MKYHLKILILFIVFSGVLMNSENVYNGTEGHKVEITCQFTAEHKYTAKYFCRQPCKSSEQVLIKTDKTDEVVSAGRYSVIYNINTNTFTVTIRNLRLKDSGVYYCGLDQWFRDTLKKVQLSVHPVPVINPLNTPAAAFTLTPKHTVSTWMTTHTSAENSSLTSTVHSTNSTSLIKSHDSPVDVILVCVVVLVLLVFWVIVAVVFLYRRRSDSKSRSLNDHVYGEAVPDPPDHNQTVEDFYHLYDEMMQEYSLVGRPKNNDTSLIYSTVQNCDPAPQNDMNSVYSLITQQQM